LAYSYYVPRASRLHALHPLTKLVLTGAIVFVGFLARSPHIPAALYICVVLPLAIWGKIAHPLVRVTLTILLPFLLSLIIVQGLFYPGTSAEHLIIGPLTFKVEGLLFAYKTAARILLLAGAGLLLLFSTHPADLMLALEQRGMPNALGYILLTAIQLLPQMQTKATAILDAQRSRGLETEGSLVVRMRAAIPLIAPLVLGALGEVDERAMALEARAFSAPRKKTNYRELADTRTQRVARWLFVLGALGIGMIVLWIP
jgi:energy-coupling factor transport system permease protein